MSDMLKYRLIFKDLYFNSNKFDTHSFTIVTVEMQMFKRVDEFSSFFLVSLKVRIIFVICILDSICLVIGIKDNVN